MSVKQKITAFIIGGYSMIFTGFGQSNITRVEYFFNMDPGFGAASSITVAPAVNIQDLPVNIPVTGLVPGLNTLFIRSANANNVWSITNQFLFLKLSLVPVPNIIAAEYFIDQDPGFGIAIPIQVSVANDIVNIPVAIDISSKSPGLHTLFVRSKDANGRWSITYSFLFLKASLPPLPDITAAEYFIDKDPGFGSAKPLPVAGSPDIAAVAASIDISSASVGLHTLFLRSKDANGKWSITNNFLFYKASNTLYNVAGAEYFVDQDPGFGNGTKISGVTAAAIDSDVKFSIGVNALAPGTHRFFIRSKNADGRWSITNFLQFNKDSVPLPVSWLSFEATPLQNDVLLQWKTASEENSSYFNVEFSADGYNFSTIGKVAAMGYTSSVTGYQFTHASPLKDQPNYYRIKQYDKDGRFTYSPIRTAKLSATPAFTAMPNPVKDKLSVFTKEQGLTVHVFASDGSNVLTQKLINTNTVINCSFLAGGMYYLVAEKNGRALYTKKIVKE